ncbi:fluoride efflux transporter CrcB [Sphaerisporangium sp. NPDC088356]|uniref:fluoride efflux transporter CrcB n=1 Tax=Sphaerisporangium sp. NPDC088356 TaxID=3154871 RepID=UPI00341A8F6C
MTARPSGDHFDPDPPSGSDLPIDSDVDVAHERGHPERNVFEARPGRRRAGALGVLVVIALGGGLGSVARYLVSQAIPTPAGHFPWATFLTNVTGCFALGLLMVFVLNVWPPSRYVRPFLGVGFLGGYTTFSTFTTEILRLAREGRWAVADSYAVGSLLAGLVAVWCGMALARGLAGIPARRSRDERSSR